MPTLTHWAALGGGGVLGAGAMLAVLLFTPAGPALRPEPAAVAPAEGRAGLTVYVSGSGTKYHRHGCRHLKSSKALTLADASLRYEPCKVCHPPR